MDIDPKTLEQQAHSFLTQDKFNEAFSLFKEAANIYRHQGNNKQAALCFASAASCWSIKSGEKTFYNSASCYEQAAKEAEKSFDFEYASLLYKYAAINYERDLEFTSFSNCFYRSKECYRRFLAYSFIHPKKINPISKGKESRGLKGFIKRALLWAVLTFSFLVWGHGERPTRTFYFGIFLIFLLAAFYTFGYLLQDGIIFRPGFFEAFYFSVITFTTVGYGDITPIGFTQILSIIESLCGLFIIPLFMIGLSRKYLRV